MSITFMLPHEFRSVTRADREAVYRLPCPSCGGTSPYGDAERVEADIDCDSCYGHGGDTSAEMALMDREAADDSEMNVSNGNAVYIVRDILNLTSEDVNGGSLDPSTILLRTSYVNTTDGVEAESEAQAVHLSEEGVSLGCRVINMGRTLRQCDSYVLRLRRLAEMAIERGAPSIHWG